MGNWSGQIRVVAGAAVLVTLAVATWKRNCVYADPEKLWRGNVTKNPQAWAAHDNLGAALQAKGRFGDAIAQYEQALRLNPNLADEDYNLGVALEQAGTLKEAIVDYEQALRVRPDDAETHYKLGAALQQAGRVQEAIGHYKQALRIRPDYAAAQNRLAQLRAAQ
jgi:tetratricopeptide (TPR) repeat protein